MVMEQWLESVYSDGSDQFVSQSSIGLGNEVSIRIQIYKDAPVKHVFVRAVPNGAEKLIEAYPVREKFGLKLYEAKLVMTEQRMNYQFYLVTENKIYYYTQNGITTYIPDTTYDFVLMADYVQPDWVRRQVFYQIFPERFCNGNPKLSVRDGEYKKDGYQTIAVKDWEQPPLSYEYGHALDFYGGDLEGIQGKIPYLKRLGVTAVYLNPIFCAPSTHKYDCSDYFHVDPHFGGDRALAELSKALHENGMKLILDISINHTGKSHKWFQKALANPKAPERDYYFFHEDGSYDGWFGNQDLPLLNYQSKKLRRLVIDGQNSVLRKWLRPPYSIDGWRFDVADVFARNDAVQLNRELWPLIRKVIREENPKAYILAEDWGDCGTYLQGKEWDSPMNYYGFGRIIRQYLGPGDLFLNRNEILRNVPYSMTAEDVEARVREHLAKIPYALWENQFNLIDSHDVSRLHHEKVSWEAYRGAIIFQFMMVGTPSIYYGDEAQIEGRTEDDAGYRAPMPWGRDFEKGEFYKLYQTLASCKTSYEALATGSMKFLKAADETIVMARFTEEEAFLMVQNHKKEETSVTIPMGAVGVIRGMNLKEVFCQQADFVWNNDKEVCMKLPKEKTYLFYVKKE